MSSRHTTTLRVAHAEDVDREQGGDDEHAEDLVGAVERVQDEKYLRAGPAEMRFQNWYTADTNHVNLSDSVSSRVAAACRCRAQLLAQLPRTAAEHSYRALQYIHAVACQE